MINFAMRCTGETFNITGRGYVTMGVLLSGTYNKDLALIGKDKFFTFQTGGIESSSASKQRGVIVPQYIAIMVEEGDYIVG